MIEKTIDFLVGVAVNGFLALFVAVFFFIPIALVFLFAMIPVSVIFGDEVASKIMDIAGSAGYKVIYVCVFVSLMMDDLGVPNIKTFYKRWWKKRRRL